MSERHQPKPAARYEIARSNRDNRINVICLEADFYNLPDLIRHLGPWTGGERGAIEDQP
jgi:hypothetical protein